MLSSLFGAVDGATNVEEGIDFCGFVTCHSPMEVGKEDSAWVALRGFVVNKDKRSAERQVILSDLYHKLSSEAKEVVQIVLETPEELVEFVAEKVCCKGRLTTSDVKEYLRYIGWGYPAIAGAFGELKKFVKNF